MVKKRQGVNIGKLKTYYVDGRWFLRYRCQILPSDTSAATMQLKTIMVTLNGSTDVVSFETFHQSVGQYGCQRGRSGTVRRVTDVPSVHR